MALRGPHLSTKSVLGGVLHEPFSPSRDLICGWRRWNLDTNVNVKLHMGEPEGEVTISSKGRSSLPPILALFLLLVPICYLVLSGIDDVGQFTSEVDCDEPVPEAWEDTCKNSKKDPYKGQFCCVIFPLLLVVILFFPIKVPHNEEEE